MPSFIQPSFAKGEISSALHGRVDTAMYYVALKTARNAIIHNYGGVSNRPGTLHIGPTKHHTYAARLFDFQFKTSDQYILEFGNLYMRVIRNDAHVVETTVNITAVTATNPVKVTALAHGYSNNDEVFIASVGGTVEINNIRFIITNKTTNTFELLDQVTGLPVDGIAYTAYTSGGTVGKIFEIVTPYVTADLSILKIVQSADVITITHPTYGIRDLARTGHDAWTLTEPTFKPIQADPIGVTLTVDGANNSVTYKYKVTAIADETFEESLSGLSTVTKASASATAANPVVVTSASHGFANGDEVEISGYDEMTEVNGRRFIVAGQTTNTFQLTGEDGSGYTAETTGGNVNQTHVVTAVGSTNPDNTISWTAASGAIRYAIYRQKTGVYGLIGEIPSAEVSFKDDNIAPDLSITPPLARNPFLLSGTFPGASTYYEQRQVYGGSTNAPDTSFYSQTGARANFSFSTPSVPSDAITATLNARQVNEIRHFVPGNDLLIFTAGAEWRINSGSEVGFETATLRQKPQSEWGSSHHRPIVSGNTIVFVEESNARLRTLKFSLEVDGYVGINLNLLAEHLLADKSPSEHIISDWAYASFPEPRIYIVRSDGDILTLTFDEEQQVIAWTTWDTKGKFERIASLKRGISGVEDAVYFVVKRKINGNTVRHIERLHSRIFADVRDAFFLDDGFSIDNPISILDVTTINPVTITTDGSHGFSNEDKVCIDDIEWEPDVDDMGNEVQPDQLNGQIFTVVNATDDTFQIASNPHRLVGYDLSSAVFTGSFMESDSNITFVLGGTNMYIKPDGTSIFLTGQPGDPGRQVVEYELTTPYEISTATFVTGQVFIQPDTQGNFITFKPDGTKMYTGSTTITEWDLDPAWDITTATSVTVSPDLLKFYRDWRFSCDGLQIFRTGLSFAEAENAAYNPPAGAGSSLEVAIASFQLTTAWDISTMALLPSAIFFHEATQINMQSGAARADGFDISNDGRYLFVYGRNVPTGALSTIQQWVLETPWDLTTAVYKGIRQPAGNSISSLPDPANQTNDFERSGLYFAKNGERMYYLNHTTGGGFPDRPRLYQWNLLSGEIVGTDEYDVDTCTSQSFNGGKGFNDFVDGGEVRQCVDVIDDIDVLEDECLSFLLDGTPSSACITVVDGKITFPSLAGRIHVGIPYITDIETLDIEASSQGVPTIQDKLINVSEVVVRFYKSRLPLVGPNSNSLLQMKQRDGEKMGEPTQLLSGKKRYSIKPSWNSNGRLFFRQRLPLPLTILEVIPNGELEDDTLSTGF